MSNAVSDDKKQEYLDVISRALENIEGSEEGFQQINRSASTLCDVNQVMNYNPNMSVVRNNGGVVIGYDYKYTGPKKPNTDALDVNSNNDTGYYGTVDAVTGADPHVAFKPLDDPRFPTTVSGGIVSDVVNKLGDFTSAMISKTFALASGLAKFGKNVADVGTQYLAALDQDYEAKFGNLLTVSGNSQGSANALRVLFGLDPLGNLTMYMDEDNLGAIGILLRDAGFFDRDPNSEAIGKPEGATDSGYNGVTYPVEFTSFAFVASNPFAGGTDWRGQGYAYSSYPVYDSQDSRYKVCFLSNTAAGVVHAFTISNGHRYFATPGSQAISFRQITYNPDTYAIIGYYDCTPGNTLTDSLGNVMKASPNISYAYNYMKPVFPVYSGSNATWALMATFYGEIHQSGGIPGISDQDGATDMVDAITGADPHVVGQNLYNQYPQVMGEPLLVNVMDDSCNQVTNRYFSVPLTYSPTNLNINTPVNATLQLDPSFNPDLNIDLNPTVDIDLDKLVDQIILQLQGSGAGEGVVVVVDDPDDPTSEPGDNIQTDPPTIPNTGSGVTPETELPQTDVHGMWHVYNPSSAEVSALGSWLWTSSIIEQIARMFNDPTNSIIGLHAIYGEPHVTSSASIVVGNLTSTVSARVVSSQYTQVDCGTVWLTEFFGNVFDYAPYTEVFIFLPFIGIVPLDVADVMRGHIQVVYNVDVYTGACIAQVSVTRDGVGGVIYQYAGNCAISYPVSAVSYNNIFSSMVAVAGGIAALAAGPEFMPVGMAMSAATAPIEARRASVSRSGSFSANAGAMGSKKPYLIIRRPQTNMALQFEKYDGRGSNFTSQLSQCSGYTKVKEVHLNIPGAYKSELDEIESLLHSGVILD